MKQLTQKLLKTQPNIGFGISRLTLGLIMLPHGAQKFLGLFGGYGYSATMDSLTNQMGLPSIVAFSITFAAERLCSAMVTADVTLPSNSI